MNLERSDEIIERFRETGQNEAWIRQVLNAPTAAEADLLLQEKQVSLTSLQQTAAVAGKAAENRQLSEDELMAVTGGGLLGDCPERYDFILCLISSCPNMTTNPASNERCCLKGFW